MFDIGGVFAFPDGDRMARELNSAIDFIGDAESCRKSFAVADETIWSGPLQWSEQLMRDTWGEFLGLDRGSYEKAWSLIGALDEETPLWNDWPKSSIDFLAKLSGQGYAIAALSNADGRLAEDLERHGLLECFDVVIDSEVEGVRKPDAEAYELAAQRLGVKVEESLFIGDSGWELSAALEAGLFGAVWFSPYITDSGRWPYSFTDLDGLYQHIIGLR